MAYGLPTKNGTDKHSLNMAVALACRIQDAKKPLLTGAEAAGETMAC